MATHSRSLVCKTLWTEEPGGVHGVTKPQTRLSDSAQHRTMCQALPWARGHSRE